MQDPESELRRIALPRTPVNKGKEKGRSVAAPALAVFYLLMLRGSLVVVAIVVAVVPVIVIPVVRTIVAATVVIGVVIIPVVVV
jgi:hypothetical protein